MAGTNVDYIIDMAVNREPALKGVKEFFRELEAIPHEAREVPVKIKVKSDLEAAIDKNLLSLKNLQKEFVEAQTATRDLGLAIAKTANQIDKVMPGAAKAIGDAMEKGGAEGQKALDKLLDKAKKVDRQLRHELQETFNSAFNSKHVKDSEAFQLKVQEYSDALLKLRKLESRRDTLVRKRDMSGGALSEEDQEKFDKVEKAIKRTKKEYREFQEAIKASLKDPKEIKELFDLLNRSISAAVGEGGDLAEKMDILIRKVRELNGITTKNVRGQTLDLFDTVNAQQQALDKMLQKTNAARVGRPVTRQSKKGKKAGSVSGEEETAQTPASETLPTSPAGPAALEAQFADFFTSRTFLARVGADPEYLLHSITSALASFADKGLKVNVAAHVGKVAAGVVAATAGGTRPITRRAASLTAAQQRRIDEAVRQDPLAVLAATRTSSQRLLPHLGNMFDALGGNDLSAVKEQIAKGSNVQKLLREAAGDTKRYSQEQRQYIESLAKQLPEIIFRPLREHATDLARLAKEAASGMHSTFNAEAQKLQQSLREAQVQLEGLNNGVLLDEHGRPKQFFHGTNEVFPDFQRAKARNNENLFGPGSVYATDNPNISSNYSEASYQLNGYMGLPSEARQAELNKLLESQKAALGNAAAMRESIELTIQKLQDPAYREANNLGSADVEAMIQRQRDQLAQLSEERLRQSHSDDLARFNKMWDEHQATLASAPVQGRNVHPLYIKARNPFDIDAQYGSAFIEQLLSHAKANAEFSGVDFSSVKSRLGDLRKAGGTLSGREIYEMFAPKFDAVSGAWKEQLPGMDKNLLNTLLEKAGFDAIKHIGGGGRYLSTTGPEHNVVIPFRDDQVLHRFTPAGQDAVKQAETAASLKARIADMTKRLAELTTLDEQALKAANKEQQRAEANQRYKDQYRDRAEYRRGVRTELDERDLAIINRRKETRARTMAAMRGEDPIGFIEGQIGKRMADLARTMDEAFKDHKGKTPEQIRGVMDQAYKASEDFNNLLINLIKQTGDKIENSPYRAKLETILQQANKLWGTRLSTFAGRDAQKNATANMRFLDWQKAAAAIRQNINDFSAYRTDFGVDRESNRWVEAQKALQSYNNSVMKFEKEMLGFANARKIADKDGQEAALKRVETARAEVVQAEQLLKYRTLLGEGSVNTGLGRSMSKANAVGFIDRALRDAIGPTFDVMNANHNKIGGLRFERVADALFNPQTKNDLALRKEWLALQIKGEVGAKEILKSEKLINDEISRRVGHLNQAYNVQKGLNNEVRTQVGLMSALDKTRTALAPYGRTLRSTISAFGIGGGIGVSFYGAMLAREQFRKFSEFQQEIAGIQGVLRSRNPTDAQTIGNAVLTNASKYGEDLLETAKAARDFAQSGLEMKQVIQELDYTMLASKGMGISIDRMQNLQLAIKATTEADERYSKQVSYTAAVLEKVSGIEARYAVNSTDLAEAITLLSPVVEQFAQGMNGLTDVFDLTIAMTTVLVERLRITGKEAGNALKFMFSRLARPEIVKKLQEQFGAHLGNKEGTDLLPLDALINELGQTYGRLQSSGNGAKAKAFASTLAGGRQINRIIPLLEEYARAQSIAIESSYQWGGVQERAAIATDTVHTAVNRLNVALQHFIISASSSTGVGRGLIATFNGIANVMNSIANASGGGGLLGTVGLALGAGGLYKAGKGAFGFLSLAGRLAAKGKSGAGAISILSRSGQAGGIVRTLAGVAKEGGIAAAVIGRLGSFFGVLAELFSPAGVLIAGGLLILGILGKLAGRGDDAAKSMAKYRTEIESLDKIKVQDSPQFIQFQEEFVQPKFGYSTAQAAEQDIISSITNPRTKAMQKLLGDVSKYSALTQEELDNFIQKNPEKVQAFKKAFTKAFIDELPSAARTGFRSIATEEGRIAEVAKAVGGAAFATNVQIANSIAAIHESTNRMIDDTLKGLAKMDSLRPDKDGQRKTIESTVSLFGSNLETRLNIAQGPKRDEQNVDFVLDLLTSTPLFKSVEDIPLLRQMATVAYNTAKNNAAPGKGQITKGDVVQELVNMFERSDRNSQASKLLQAAMLRDTFPTESLSLLADANLLPNQLTQGQQIQLGLKKSLTLAQNQYELDARDKLSKLLEGSAPSRAIDRLFRSNFGTGTDLDTSALGAGSKHATEAINKFRSALLDLTKSIYEAVDAYHTEKAFAKEFGQPFDQGNSLVTLGKSLRTAGQRSELNRLMDLMSQSRNLQDVQYDAEGKFYTIRQPDGTVKKASERETAKIEGQLAHMRKEGQEIQSSSMADIFSGSPEAEAAMKDFSDKFKDALGDAGLSPDVMSATLLKIVHEFADALIKAGFHQDFISKDTIQRAELLRTLVGKQFEYQKELLPINATLAEKMQLGAQAAFATFNAEKNLLDAQLSQGKISTDDYQLALKKLAAESEINALYDARSQAAQAQRELNQQILTDLSGMFSGIRNTLTDTSIWDAILNPKGNTAEEKARAKGVAIRNALSSAISPIFTTIADRIIENTYQSLIEKLSKSKFLTGLLGNVETKLSAEAQGAQLVSQSIVGAFGAGATIISSAITNSFATAGINSDVSSAVSSATSSLGGVTLPGSSLATLAANSANGSLTTQVTTATDQATKAAQDKLAKDIADQVAAANQDKAASTKNSMFSAGGMIAGNIGGTIAGGGGQGARTGAAIGSTVGTMAGNAILPGIGGFIGGTLGGLLGGAIGGSTDDSVTEPQAVIKGLSAIERAQKETITAIQSQTDALLKPENRLFNLPATFSIPAYAPSIGPQAGGSGAVTQRVLNLNVGNITVGNGAAGMSPNDVQKAFENAMGKVLNDQRNAQAWR